MRLRTFILLIFTILGCINDVFASVTLPAAEHPPQDRLDLRFLRINDDEERGLQNLADAAKLKVYTHRLNQLKLGDDLEAVLKSPQVKKLSKFNRNRDPTKQVALVGKISAKFGDDVVARTLVYLERKAGDNPKFLAVLKQLREEQVAEWVKKDKNIPQVVTLLKFADDETVFRSIELDVLEDFIKKFNAAKGGDETLLKTLATFYGDESRLVTMVTKAKNHRRSVEKAKEVENQLLHHWKSDKISASDLWARLKFGDDIGEALNSGKVTIYAKHVSNRDSVLKSLDEKYGEANVAMSLARAQGNPATVKIASVLQKKQLSGWLSKEESLDNVFELLKFRENNGLPYKLDILYEYLKIFKNKNPQDGTTVLMVLRKGFGNDEDELVLMLSRALRSPGSESMRPTIKRYRKLIYDEWVKNDLDPIGVAVNVFKISRANVATSRYSTEIKRIISQYSKFYKRKTVGVAIEPRTR